jgi:hypothetical protein
MHDMRAWDEDDEWDGEDWWNDGCGGVPIPPMRSVGRIERFDTFPDVRCMRDSGKGLLCLMPAWCGDLGVEIWVPLSQISSSSEIYKVEQYGNLVVRSWWVDRAMKAYCDTKDVDSRRRDAVRQALRRRKQEDDHGMAR